MCTSLNKQICQHNTPYSVHFQRSNAMPAVLRLSYHEQWGLAGTSAFRESRLHLPRHGFKDVWCTFINYLISIMIQCFFLPFFVSNLHLMCILIILISNDFQPKSSRSNHPIMTQRLTRTVRAGKMVAEAHQAHGLTCIPSLAYQQHNS